MKRIHKSDSPNYLTIYEKNNSSNTWNDFYIYNQGKDYSLLKQTIFNDQGSLCAYCETEIKDTDYTKRRIEHFHNKSPHLVPPNTHNWALDWSNIFGVCLGGSDSKEKNHPTPSNLSCDSYKEHKKISDSKIFNPLLLPKSHNLFSFNKSNGNLTAHKVNCDNIIIANNPYQSTVEFIENTINKLNLNCYRLNSNRLSIFILYERERKKARIENNINFKNILAERWFSKRWPSFFTTRRILLGETAEKYLDSINCED